MGMGGGGGVEVIRAVVFIRINMVCHTLKVGSCPNNDNSV